MVVEVVSGNVVQEIEYDAWGRVVDETGTAMFQPFGFAGGIRDEDTGWALFGARDYRPEVGAWAAKDPAGFAAGDSNLYRYVHSDPVNRVDLSGAISSLRGCVNSPAGVAMCAEAGITAVGGGAAIHRAMPSVRMVCQAAIRGFHSLAQGGAAIVRSAGRDINYLGSAAENAVRNAFYIGPSIKSSITWAGRLRIPDGMDTYGRVLTEIKNVGRLSYTRQLRDMAAWAEANGYTFQLFIRKGAHLSKPLLQAIADGKLIPKHIPTL